MSQNLQKKRSRQRFWDRFTNFIIAFIPVLGFLLFSLVPLAISLVMSMFQMYSTDFSEATFVGFDNYYTLLVENVPALTDGYTKQMSDLFYRSFLNNLIFWLNVPISMAIGLGISYLINKNIKCKRLFRTIFFVPYVCSAVAVSYSFKTMYEFNYGVFNSMLKGMGFAPVEWTNSDPMFMWSCTIMQSWKNIGYCVILLQAALARVDKSLLEAAQIDGASEGRIFWRIVFPAITPIIFYLLTVCTIGAWQSMQEMRLLYPANSSLEYGFYTPTYYMYDMMFGFYAYTLGFGLAAAAGWILAIFILIITQVNMKLSTKWVHYEF